MLKGKKKKEIELIFDNKLKKNLVVGLVDNMEGTFIAGACAHFLNGCFKK